MKTKDFSFARYFNLDKNVQHEFPERSKHKPIPNFVWNSANYYYVDDNGKIQTIRGQGTYVRAVHGLFPLDKKVLKQSLKEFYKNNKGLLLDC